MRATGHHSAAAGYNLGLAHRAESVKKFIENASSITGLLARWLLLAGCVFLLWAGVRSASVLLEDELAPYGAVTPSSTGVLSDGRLVRARGQVVCAEPPRIRLSVTSASQPVSRDTMAGTLLLREASWQLCAAHVAGALTKEQYANSLLSVINRTADLPYIKQTSPDGMAVPKVKRTRKIRGRRSGKRPCKCDKEVVNARAVQSFGIDLDSAAARQAQKPYGRDATATNRTTP